MKLHETVTLWPLHPLIVVVVFFWMQLNDNLLVAILWLFREYKVSISIVLPGVLISVGSKFYKNVVRPLLQLVNCKLFVEIIKVS